MKILITLLFLCITSQCFGISAITHNTQDSTYRIMVGANEVIIGNDKNITEVEPHITVTRWNKENSISISAPANLINSTVGALSGEKVEIKDSKTGWYANQNPDNLEQMKFGLILYEKPITNTWVFGISGHEGLKLNLRPPFNKDNGDGTKTLTTSGGVGEHAYSYIVSSETITGKLSKEGSLLDETNSKHFLSILRPKFIDNRGDWVWADLEIKDSNYIITVDQEFLDKAVYPVKVNDTATYQQDISGYTAMEDTQMRGSGADTNYGTNVQLSISSYFSFISMLIRFDLSGELSTGDTITNCKLEIYNIYADGGVGTDIGSFRCLKPWTEAGATFNDWVNPDSEWTIAGASSTSDAGDYNSGDGTDYDAWDTPDDTLEIIGDGWQDFGGVDNDATADTLQAQLDSGNWEGWVLAVLIPSVDCNYRSSEYTDDTSLRPKLTVTYTPAAAPSTGGVPSQIWILE